MFYCKIIIFCQNILAFYFINIQVKKARYDDQKERDDRTPLSTITNMPMLKYPDAKAHVCTETLKWLLNSQNFHCRKPTLSLEYACCQTMGQLTLLFLFLFCSVHSFVKETSLIISMLTCASINNCLQHIFHNMIAVFICSKAKIFTLSLVIWKNQYL